MKSDDRRTIFTKRNILLFILLILIIFILLIGCQWFKNKNNEPEFPIIIEPTSINVDVSNLNLKVGETKQVIATVFPIDATEQTLSYATSDDNVATVDGNGNITGVGAGTAIITISTSNGISTQVTVIVTEDKPETTNKPSISFGSPKGTKGSNGWYISNVTVKVTAKDAGSIKYCKSSGVKCTPNKAIKSGESIIIREGTSKIYVSATNSNGTTTANTSLIKVDTTAPTIAFTDNAGESGVKLVATCKDSISGISKCAGGASTPHTVSDVKETATYTVVDKAGNKAEKVVTIKQEQQYREKKCTPSYSSWTFINQSIVGLGGCDGLTTKESAEVGGCLQYQVCHSYAGGSTGCVTATGEPMCYILSTYTRTCTSTNCTNWSDWKTGSKKSTCSNYTQNRKVYVANY